MTFDNVILMLCINLHIFVSIFHVSVLADEENDGEVVINTECTSYMQNLDQSHLLKVAVSFMKKCKAKVNLIQFSQNIHICTMRFKFIPTVPYALSSSACVREMSSFRTAVFETAFGTAWGCEENRATVAVHPYYTVAIQVPRLDMMGLSYRVDGYCEIPSLLLRDKVELTCLMNKYGGYEWIVESTGGCAVPEFQNASFALMDKLKSAPAYCGIRMFLLYVQMAKCLQDGCVNSFADQLVARLVEECQYEAGSWLPATRADFYKIIDILLSGPFWGDTPFGRVLESIQIALVYLTRVLTEYFLSAKSNVVQRGQLWTFRRFRKIKLDQFYSCSPFISIKFEEIQLPASILCNSRLSFIEELPVFGMYVVVAHIMVLPHFDEPYVVHVKFTVPPFHQPGHYLCGKYKFANFGVMRGSIDSCVLEEITVTHVICKCTVPGVYLLLQLTNYLPTYKSGPYTHNPITDVLSQDHNMDLVHRCNPLTYRHFYMNLDAILMIFLPWNQNKGELSTLSPTTATPHGFFLAQSRVNKLFDRPPIGLRIGRIINRMNQPITAMLHTTVMALVVFGIIVNMYIRWSPKCFHAYSGAHKGSPSLKAFLDLILHEHILVFLQVLLQLIAIQMTNERRCALIGALSHTVIILLAIFHLLGSVALFAVGRIHQFYNLVVKITATAYVLGAISYTILNAVMPSEYRSVSCLPHNMLYSLTCPMLGLDSITAVMLLVYWIRRPYRYLDEWFGLAVIVAMDLFIWISLLDAPPPSNYASKSVIRLLQMNLFESTFVAVYYTWIKPSIIRCIWTNCLVPTGIRNLYGAKDNTDKPNEQAVPETNVAPSKHLRMNKTPLFQFDSETEPLSSKSDFHRPSRTIQPVKQIQIGKKHPTTIQLPPREKLRESYLRRKPVPSQAQRRLQ
ncbi:hypothetical protein D915_002701 [Fasciola hepatica]|uniref:Uncharacterized protein n=1 Tax=Fasciola hepatica TaxID=6192 RepID=A0A4E0RWS4_FASHE|nr:hypothetical protein D915_002701 [Fasciola hepatica]